MYSSETGVRRDSDYYIFTASVQAKKTFFYPTYVGYFYYEPNYYLHRNSYDSFLIMHVKKGSCYIEVDNHRQHVEKNQIVFLDCYKPHTYYTHTGWEAEWLHFDGPVAREYFNMITSLTGLVITLRDTYIFEKYLHKIYLMFRENKPIKEALVSQYITNILTELLISRESTSSKPNNSNIVDETIAYINEHLCENMSLELLSSRASLSPYYFTRMFKNETGFTPHEYIIASRINSAKFLLKNTDISIKEICFSTGFSSESAFCSTFKKREKCTPSAYRNSNDKKN
ncbi:MAG: AraC family transcriptional regulator [Clostridiales bacterium]|jgi:AraC family transcriptional regulator|nr:AraC family transcriptional regulator [Clostridiales bacterium]